MNSKQTKAVRAFRSTLNGVKRHIGLFALGMITGASIIGFFEAIEYQSIYEPNLPWWIYVIIAIVAIALVGRISEH